MIEFVTNIPLPTPRDITKVIDMMMPYTNHEMFRDHMQRIKNNCLFTPNELIHKRWDELSDAVNHYIPNPPQSRSDLNLVSIFVNLPIKDVKKKWGIG